MKTGYEIYCEWCRERGQTPPTKEWWDWACAANTAANRVQRRIDQARGFRADQREIDRERREGWAYGK